jgi:hypothetical protein
MKNIQKYILLIFFLVFQLFTCFGQTSGNGLSFSPGFNAGYNRGLGFHVTLTAKGFSAYFPFEIRAGIGYTSLNPGNASDVRRIFINNATNGVPEKNGRSWDYRIDFLISKSVLGMSHVCIVLGPRFSTYNGHFKYVGGNEDFNIKSKQWGIGGGLENHFHMMERLNLIIALGLDFYFPSTLTGHDTSYSPDNDNVNPRNDNQNGDVEFIYKDANKAVYQPVLMPRAMVGIEWEL